AFTPGTACRLALTVCGQAAQYMFFTANVMVLSAAKAAVEGKTLTAMGKQGGGLVIGVFPSRGVEWGRYAKPPLQKVHWCRWAGTVKERSRKGARRRRRTGGMRSTAPKMSPSGTSRIDNGRAHASPPAHATFDAR